MRFVKYLVGGILLVGAIFLVFWVRWPFIFGNKWTWDIVLWAIVTVLAFFGGSYLMRHN